MTHAFKRLLPVSAIALALVAGGCGDDEKSSSESQSTPAPTAAATISSDLSTKPEIPKPEGDPPAKLVTRDIVEGKGPKARKGDTLTMQYVGVSYSTGEQFDASWDNGQPFTFPVGAGQVIPGWDKGIPGMRVGGRRELIIPPDLAYGPSGQPPVIAPNETLVFVVDLKKIG